MSDIPERPLTPPAGYYGESHVQMAWERHFSMMAFHEHLVAKTAVEALQWKHMGGDDYVQEHAHEGVDHHPGCNRCEALKAIYASGWRP